MFLLRQFRVFSHQLRRAEHHVGETRSWLAWVTRVWSSTGACASGFKLGLPRKASINKSAKESEKLHDLCGFAGPA